MKTNSQMVNKTEVYDFSAKGIKKWIHLFQKDELCLILLYHKSY